MSVNASVVDPLCRCSPSAAIYKDAQGLRWAFMLNQTNISGTFGNNKFYMVQLIQEANYFVVFRRWGRVGAKTPQFKREDHWTLDTAMHSIQSVFLSKSGNKWPLEKPFEKKKGKYTLIEMEDEDAAVEEKEQVEDEKYRPCTLPTPVQKLLELVSDPENIAREMATLNIDLKRMPLGRLSKSQISRGYSILKELSSALEEIEERSAPPTSATPPPTTRSTRGRGKGRGGKAKAKAPTRGKQADANNAKAIRELKASLKTLSGDFYTVIPHDFGHSMPPVIDSMDALREKLELLDVLSNVEISQGLDAAEKAAKKTKKTTKNADDRVPHPLDRRYEAIQAKMEPVDPSSDEFKLIEKFMTKTSSGYRMPKIHSILKVARPAEEQFADSFKAVDNHRLLWHGSRLSNIVGILSQGLRIAPPEAPVNGYNFGKGLYFADAMAKSSSYCYTSFTNPTGVLFLAEVALGKQYQTPQPEFLDYDKVKKTYGCDSTHGMGSMEPRPDAYEVMPDGVIVPAGELMPNQVSGCFGYNEFIVYRTEQAKLRYVLTVDI